MNIDNIILSLDIENAYTRKELVCLHYQILGLEDTAKTRNQQKEAKFLRHKLIERQKEIIGEYNDQKRGRRSTE